MHVLIWICNEVRKDEIRNSEEIASINVKPNPSKVL